MRKLMTQKNLVNRSFTGNWDMITDKEAKNYEVRTGLEPAAVASQVGSSINRTTLARYALDEINWYPLFIYSVISLLQQNVAITYFPKTRFVQSKIIQSNITARCAR